MDAIATYKQNAIATQSPGQTVVLLYEGAIRLLREAEQAMAARDSITKGCCISKAMDIIQELDSALNMEAGGEVASNLRKLYEFMTRRLLYSSVKLDVQALREVIRLLEDLHQAWKTIAH